MDQKDQMGTGDQDSLLPVSILPYPYSIDGSNYGSLPSKSVRRIKSQETGYL